MTYISYFEFISIFDISVFDFLLYSLDKPYHIINLILAGIIMMIFIYSGLFSAEKDNHPIPSFYEKITGEQTASSGLSRSFSEIVRGRFESARTYNQYGIPVFVFFLVQLFQRIIISIILRKNLMSNKRLIIVDIILSSGLFIYCFRGLITEYFHNFY